MANRIPTRLKNDPLQEAIWEFRFLPSAGASHVLPGLLYSRFRSEFPAIVRLPLADAPDQLVESQQSLWYLPRLRLEGTARAIQIGYRALTLNCLRPYPGWRSFSEQILGLVEELQNSMVIEAPERFSFKYLNVLSRADDSWLSRLNVDLRLGDWNVAQSPVQIRAQVRSGEFTHILQIAAPATVNRIGEGSLEGAVVEIETVSDLPARDQWAFVKENLDFAHDACKEAFFSLLRQETLDSLLPEFEE